MPHDPVGHEPVTGCRGSITAEHVAVLTISAALIAALLAVGLPRTVGDWAQYASCLLFSSEDACERPGDEAIPTATEQRPVGGLTDEDLRPTTCLVLRESEQAGYEVKFGFVTFGEDYGFIRQEFSDGTVRLTAVDGASLGLQGRTRTRILDIGKLSTDEQVGWRADLGGGVSIEYGDTWEFASVAEERAMREQLDAYLMQQQQLRQGGEGAAGLHIWLWLSNGYLDPPRDPMVTFSRVSADVALGGQVGLRSPLGPGADGEQGYLDPQVGGRLELDAGYDVLVENHHGTGHRSYTYTLSGGASGQGDITVGRGGFTGSSSGSVTETYDEDGQLIGIEFTTTREGGVSGSLNASNPVEGGSGPTGSVGRTEGTATVTTTRLAIEDDEQRAVVEAWRADNSQRFGTPFSLAVSHAVPDERVEADAFQNLLHEQARVSHVTYDDVTDVQRFGLEVTLGKQFGVSVHHITGERTLSEMGYLGAPTAGEQRPWIEDATC